MRPDIVWFGETPYQMEQIYHALSQCDLFVSIGTSGNVYPAAGFVQQAALGGAVTLEINLEPSLNAHVFDSGLYGAASEKVPEFALEILRDF
jgi:NAD-dependent deacetylase